MRRSFLVQLILKRLAAASLVVSLLVSTVWLPLDAEIVTSRSYNKIAQYDTAIQLKGRVFYVTAVEKATYDLCQTLFLACTAFGCLCIVGVGMLRRGD
jgi:hypothetical protein